MTQKSFPNEWARYANLINDFIVGNILPIDFERQYLVLFKRESCLLPEEVFASLNQLFEEVDAYCGAPELRDTNDPDEAQLFECALRTLAALDEASR